MSRLSIRGVHVILGVTVVVNALWIGGLAAVVFCGMRAWLT